MALHGLPTALEVTATIRRRAVRGDDEWRQVEDAWARDAHNDPTVAIWLISRTDGNGESLELRGSAMSLLTSTVCATITGPGVAAYVPLLDAIAKGDVAMGAQPFERLACAARDHLRLAVDAAGPGDLPTPSIDATRLPLAAVWVAWVAAQPAPDPEDVCSALEIAGGLVNPRRDPAERLAMWARDVTSLAQHDGGAMPADLMERLREVLLVVEPAPLDPDRLIGRLAVTGPQEAVALWREDVAPQVNGPARARVAVAARRKAHSAPLVAALAVLAADDDMHLGDLAPDVLHHLAADGLTPMETAWLGLAASRIALTRAERSMVREQLAGTDIPAGIVALALLAPLSARSAAVTTAAHRLIRALRNPASAARVGVIEVEMLCTDATSGAATQPVTEAFLAASPAREGWQRIRALALVARLRDARAGNQRELAELTMVDEAAEDMRLAHELLRRIPAEERPSPLAEVVAAHFGDVEEIAVALAPALDAYAPWSDVVRRRLLSAAVSNPAAALALVADAGRRRDPSSLAHALRHLTASALAQPGVIADVATGVDSPWARVEVTAWLIRLASAARRDPRIRSSIEAARDELNRRPARGTAHASVALATTPVAARRAADMLLRVSRRDRLSELDAVAVLAVERRDGAARDRAVRRLTLPGDHPTTARYARLLASLHPAALVAVAALQPRTRQPLTDLAHELDARSGDDDLCTAELLDLLTACTSVADATVLARLHRTAQADARRWIATGSQACCVPAARSAARLRSLQGGIARERELAKVLAHAMDFGNQGLRLAALDAWDLLDPAARPAFDTTRVRRLRRTERSPSSTATRFVPIPMPVVPVFPAPAASGAKRRSVSHDQDSHPGQPDASPRAQLPRLRSKEPQMMARAPGVIRTTKHTRGHAWSRKGHAPNAWSRRAWLLGALVVAVGCAVLDHLVVKSVRATLGEHGWAHSIGGPSVSSGFGTFFGAVSHPVVVVLICLPAAALLVIDFAGRLPGWTAGPAARWAARGLCAAPGVPLVLFCLVAVLNFVVAALIAVLVAVLALVAILVVIAIWVHS